MKFLTSLVAVALLGSTAVPLIAGESYQEQFAQLSRQEQAATRSEAVKKEDYDQMPKAPSSLNEFTITEFCKLLPRGLERMIPDKLSAKKQSSTDRKRTQLWALYISCQDSLLYFEGHRFFKSGHYSATQSAGAINEIKTVMNWLIAEEQKLDSNKRYTGNR